MTLLYLYIIAGIALVICEHNSYDFSSTDSTMKRKALFLNIAQQVIHYSRYILTWPWYVLEDFLVMLDNEDEEEYEPYISKCPRCEGPADNGFDRSYPPEPYLCTKCDPTSTRDET